MTKLEEAIWAAAFVHSLEMGNGMNPEHKHFAEADSAVHAFRVYKRNPVNAKTLPNVPPRALPRPA